MLQLLRFGIVFCASHAWCGNATAVQALFRLPDELEPSKVLLRDVSEEQFGGWSAAKSFVDKGFALLSPALPNDQFKREEFKIALTDGDAIAAMALLAKHPQGLMSLGFRWVFCSTPTATHMEPDGNSSRNHVDAGSHTRTPTATVGMVSIGKFVKASLFRFPSAGRLLKVWLPVRVPVQPLAFAELLDGASTNENKRQIGGNSRQRWWWAGESQTVGDVVIIDALRTPHTSVSLPGEALLANYTRALQRLRASLVDMRNATTPKVALDTCTGFHAQMVDPFPSLVIGGRYEVLTKEYAILRKETNVESAVIGMLEPGSVVTVLGVGTDGGTSRAQVYTEHALAPVKGADFVSDDTDGWDLLGSGSNRGGPMTGWVMHVGLDRQPALRSLASPVGVGEDTPQLIKRQIEGLAAVVQGICSWLNFTATASPSMRTAESNVEYILDRHIQDLAGKIEESRHVAFEAQCLAVAHPGRPYILAGFVTSAAVSIVAFRSLLHGLRDSDA